MISIAQLCDFIRVGLSFQTIASQANNGKIRIRSVSFLNNMTFVCEFYPYAKTSMEVKAEIGYIMSFVSAFLKDNEYTPKTYRTIAVRAYDSNDEELLYAMSSKEIAELAGEGRPIEWLRNTEFQDNTPDFRLGVAKQKIAEIENTLRVLIIENLSQSKGVKWWEACVRSKVKNDASKAYQNQNGINSSQGEELIYYTFLLQLKDIVVDNYSNFASTFQDESLFRKWIDDLNKIRRTEAHNRNISSADIFNLNIIYDEIMNCIAISHPHLVSGFQVINWRQRIYDIVNEYSINQISFDKMLGNDIVEVVDKINLTVIQLDDVLLKVNSVPIPPGKHLLHERIIGIFFDLKESFEEMIKSARAGDISEIHKAVSMNADVRDRIKNFIADYLKSES